MNYKSRIHLKGGLVYTKDKLVKMDILIDNGVVINMGEIEVCDATVINCDGLVISPSFVDTHVHFRDPGDGKSEDIESGSYAAIKGGYTHVFEMPNTTPCLDDVQEMKDHLRKIEQKAHCVVTPFSAATKNLQGKQMVDINQMSQLDIAGFSDDGKGIQEDAMMRELLIEAGKNKKMVSAHCEDESEFETGMGCIMQSSKAEEYHLKGINKKSEFKMIARDLKLIDEIHNKHPYHYHVCHLSCKESLDLVKEAKQKGHHVSCEVTPHHLISTVDEIDIHDGNYKMNPPLRLQEDVDSLVQGLNDGSIDIIATDHAPHHFEKKQGGVEKSAFGIIGLELSFSLLNTYLVKTKKVSLEKILKALTTNPTRLFVLDKGLAIGKDAYITLIDLSQEVNYTSENLVSKSKNTFYLNRALTGKVVATIVKEKIYHW